jgi:hypothetical protein
VLENPELLKLDSDRINKKKVPEKNKTKPIDIQIEDTLYSSFLIILSYNKRTDEDKIKIDSTPVGIESNSFKVPVAISKTTNREKIILEIFIKVR